MKFKKSIITAGTLLTVIAPLATVVACEDKHDELVFDGYKETPREFTISKNKELLESFIRPAQKVLRRMATRIALVNTIQKAKDAMNAVEADKKELDALVPKFDAFNESIIGKEYNNLSETYLKALDLVDRSVGNVTTQGNISRVYNSLKEVIGSTLRNLTTTALQGLVIYSDSEASDKTQVVKNSFWIDKSYVNANVDQTENQNKIDWTNITVAWAQIIVQKGNELRKTSKNDYEVSEKLVEFAKNAILVYTEENGNPKVVPGDVDVKVERGSAASQEDVLKANAKLYDESGNKTSWTNVGDTSKLAALNSSVKWFKNDEFWLPKSSFATAVAELLKPITDSKGDPIIDQNGNSQTDKKYVDLYRTYLETETGQKFASDTDLIVRNSEDYYKFVEIASKSIQHGRDALAKLEPKAFKKLPDNTIFSIIINRMGLNDKITVIKSGVDPATVPVVSGGILIVSGDESPWGLFPQVKDTKTFDDAVISIANEYGEAGIKSALEAIYISDIDTANGGKLDWLKIDRFYDAGDLDWRQPLAIFVRS